MSEIDYDSEDEFEISVQDQKNNEKYLFIPQNCQDLSFGKSDIFVRDMAEFKAEQMFKTEYVRIVKMQHNCLGKSHVAYAGDGLYFNNTAIDLLKDEDNEDGLILGDVILFSQSD
jgi:hypothetical protein